MSDTHPFSPKDLLNPFSVDFLEEGRICGLFGPFFLHFPRKTDKEGHKLSKYLGVAGWGSEIGRDVCDLQLTGTITKVHVTTSSVAWQGDCMPILHAGSLQVTHTRIRPAAATQVSGQEFSEL